LSGRLIAQPAKNSDPVKTTRASFLIILSLPLNLAGLFNFILLFYRHIRIELEFNSSGNEFIRTIGAPGLRAE
jgi:hypothetical protein